MKGFIACTLAFAPIYADANLDRDIHFSYTFDEETACIGAPILIEELKKRGVKDGICIIGEPTNMKIIDAFGKIFFISGKSTSFAYLSSAAFKKTPSSLTTGLVSQLTWHLSAITLCAIPTKIPPIDRVEWGGSKIESLGDLSFSFSLNSISLFTYLDAYSTALTPLCGAELWPANPSK